jgi:hypothetical protein
LYVKYFDNLLKGISSERLVRKTTGLKPLVSGQGSGVARRFYLNARLSVKGGQFVLQSSWGLLMHLKMTAGTVD